MFTYVLFMFEFVSE